MTRMRLFRYASFSSASINRRLRIAHLGRDLSSGSVPWKGTRCAPYGLGKQGLLARPTRFDRDLCKPRRLAHINNFPFHRRIKSGLWNVSVATEPPKKVGPGYSNA